MTKKQFVISLVITILLAFIISLGFKIPEWGGCVFMGLWVIVFAYDVLRDKRNK